MNSAYIFTNYFLLFLIYSFIGWVIEVSAELINNKKIVNRGFLIGPIVPIWGFGAVLITIFIKSSDSPLSLIVTSAFIGTALEYVVNYLMEKIFKARWWDYSHLPFNINGRVWLGSSILFGFGGYFLVNYLNPFFLNIISKINPSFAIILSSILLIVLALDLVISCDIITKLNLSAHSLKKDYTEEVSKKVKLVLEEKSNSFRRILKAFPDVTFQFKKK